MSIFPAIAPINLLTGPGAIRPINISLPLATTGVPAFGDSTVVEISGVGQLLSAVSNFQTNLAALAPGSGSAGLGQNFGTDVGSLAAEAQFFVDAFNGLKNTINGLTAPTGSLTGEPLASQFAAALNSQATAVNANGDSTLTRLSQIGINFQPSPIPGNAGSLNIDMNVLKASFQADAAGTFSLLTQAVNAFGDLADSFTSQTSSLFTMLGAQLQANNIQQALISGLLNSGLGLFGNTGLFSSSLGGLGLVGLLALESSLGQNQSASGVTQQIEALNQSALVSSLLG